MSIKLFLKNNVLTKGLYAKLKKMRDDKQDRNCFRHKGRFQDRSAGKEKLCIVLAGYKEFLYPAVFGRIKAYMEEDIDVCVVTSGLFSEKVDALCKENNWSYLSTKNNNVALVQNVAISLHPNAKYIYKLDEDIFITKGYFSNMMRAFEHAKTGEYTPGVMAPLLPINGYAHVRILKKLGLDEHYAANFEEVKYMAGPDRQIENNPAVAEFMWGEGGLVPDVDEMNRRFSAEPLEERACPIRFSIGAILFERSLWEAMRYFKVDRRGNAMGQDEEELCAYCCIHSRPLMVSENIVVGHLSFGKQNKPMQAYYDAHPERFYFKN
jgi:hypothetical protein